MRPGHGRRYGASVRDRVCRAATQLRQGGASWRDVGRAPGIPLDTIRRICSEGEAIRPGFVPVEIAPNLGRGELAIVTPGGHRAEGLDLETGSRDAAVNTTLTAPLLTR